MSLPKGLTSREAKARLRLWGVNELEQKTRAVWWKVLFSQFKSPLIYLLVGASGLNLMLREWWDSLIIMLAVVANTGFSFFQDYKAEKSLEALNRMLTKKAKVKRDGDWKEINLREVVPGDIARLEIGQSAPADGWLLVEDGIHMNEALLTGESMSVKKTPISVETEEGLEWKTGKEVNKCFMGTVVERGIGEMVVVKTGSQTRMGQIAKEVSWGKEGLTPLQRKLNRLGRQLAVLALAAGLMMIGAGMMRGLSFEMMIPTGVALAVAAIPEGLALGLTVVLTAGMRRILQKRVLVRRLVAAETLGGVSVICLDKTGTLTVGKMIAKGGVSSASIEVEEQLKGNQDRTKLDLIMKGSILCNDRRDPLEEAMREWAVKELKTELKGKYKRVDELPFDPKYKYIVTRHEDGEGGFLEFLSGAPEVILGLSKDVEESERRRWQKQFAELGDRGYRIVGFSYKTIVEGGSKINRDQVGNYQWLGVVFFEDPIREGVSEALVKAKEAGIGIKVITGDYRETGWAVIREAGLVEGEFDPEKVMLGDELAGLSAKEIERKVGKAVLFARTTPEQKLIIVRALQKKGEVVAMMGDGVNDAPALKEAEIGVVVNNASDVAREMADMVLLDNNFGHILEAVEEGRVMYLSIKKLLGFLLSVSFAEIVLVGLSIALGWPLPLIAVQILWISLVSEGFPAAAIALESKGKNLLRKTAVRGSEAILDKELVGLIGVGAVVTGVMALVAFGWSYWVDKGDIEAARSLAFVVLGVSCLLHIKLVQHLGERQSGLGLVSRRMWGGIAVGGIMILLAMYLPGVQSAFQLKPLQSSQLLILGWAVAASLVLREIGLRIVYRVVSARVG